MSNCSVTLYSMELVTSTLHNRDTGEAGQYNSYARSGVSDEHNFLFSKVSRPNLQPSQSHTPWVPWAPSPGLEWLWHYSI